MDRRGLGGTIVRERIRRTWRQRLLSWPWRPWVAYTVKLHRVFVFNRCDR